MCKISEHLKIRGQERGKRKSFAIEAKEEPSSAFGPEKFGTKVANKIFFKELTCESLLNWVFFVSRS
jgi:hypothetical protein